MKFAPLFMILLLASDGCPNNNGRARAPDQITPVASDVVYVAWMSEITAGMGLEEEIGVVPGLAAASKRCTQAVIGKDGRKYIAYSRGCLPVLEEDFGYNWCTVATLAHGLAHHLGDPVGRMGSGARYPKVSDEVEGPQDRRAFKFVGYVLYRLSGKPEDIGYCPSLRNDTPLMPEQWGEALQAGYENARDRDGVDDNILRDEVRAFRKGIKEESAKAGRLEAENEDLEDEVQRWKVWTYVASGTAGAGFLASIAFAFLWRRSLRR